MITGIFELSSTDARDFHVPDMRVIFCFLANISCVNQRWRELYVWIVLEHAACLASQHVQSAVFTIGNLSN